MEGRYNTRSPAVKRLMKEAQELSEPTDQYYAQPLEDNLFEWHFTVRGPADSEFQNGIYHGRIVLPVDYPMKPPSIIWLTPNGRFETNKKICLSISGHHPESWQPSWSIRTALLAIIGFMPTHGGGAIGSLDYTADERKVLAKKSREWKCPSCGDVQAILLEPSTESKATSEEVKKLAAQINFQPEQSKNTCSADIVAKPSTTSGQSTSSQADKPQRSSSHHDIPVTTSGQQSAQMHSATSYTWNPNQPSGFNPWGMPPYPNMGGYPLHQSTSSTHTSAVSMMPRFPFPPGHHQRYESPFFMPGLPVLSTSPQQIPALNPTTFRLINQARALPGQQFRSCNSPFNDVPTDASESSESFSNSQSNSSKSEKELSNKNTKNVSSCSHTPDAAAELTKEETNSSEVAQETMGAEADQEVMGAEAAATPLESPVTESLISLQEGDHKDIGPKGVRHRSVNAQVPNEVPESVRSILREARPNGGNNYSASGDRAGQTPRPGSENPVTQRGTGSAVGRNFDYTGVLILVLSLCTLLILLKRVVQYVIAEEMI